MNLPLEEQKQIENEMLFRRANERVGSDLDEVDALHIEDGNPQLVRNNDLLLDFKCECSDEDCNERISMQLSIYRQLHTDRSMFVIKRNHEVKPIEQVIQTTDTYSVVLKKNITAEPIEGAPYNNTSIDNSND